MRTSRFSEEQVTAIFREQEHGHATENLCRRQGIIDGDCAVGIVVVGGKVIEGSNKRSPDISKRIDRTLFRRRIGDQSPHA
ncbi:MAG: hypothetical protein KJ622_08930 [Alphaproteobacteria bacterium]|nr:hypothetical protein [Alphaproteobacteria bacterium]